MEYRIFESEYQRDGSLVEHELLGDDLDGVRPAPNGGIEKMNIITGGGDIWINWIDASNTHRIEWRIEED